MIRIWNCFRCGYEWASRKQEKPRCCAKCKILYWDRPARVPKQYHEPKAIGRPALYPVQLLKVGDDMLLPWYRLPSDWPDENKNHGMNVAIQNYAKRTNKILWTEGTARGLKVYRRA